MKSTIGRKIALAFFVLILLMITMVVITIQGFNSISAHVTELEREAVKRGVAGNLRFTISQLLMPANDYLITENKLYQMEYEQINARVEKTYEHFIELPLTKDEQTFISDIKRDIDSIRSLSVKIFAIDHPKKEKQAAIILKEMDYRFAANINLKTTVLFDSISSRIEKTRLRLAASQEYISNLIYGILLLSVLISLGFSYLTVARIAKPIVVVTKAANGITNGDYSHRPVVDTHDEVAILAKAFSRMAESIQTSQESLMKSEKKYRDLFESTSDIIQVISPEGKMLYANRAWRETLGYTEEETRTMNIDQIIHPDQQGHCRNIFAKAVQGEKIKSYKINLLTKEGKTIYAEGNISCRFESGIPKSITCFLKDITESRKQETEIKESEERFRTLTESSASIIVMLQNNKICYVNQTAKDLTGFSSQEYETMSVLDFIHPEHRDEIIARNSARLKGDPVSSQLEVRILTKAGEVRWVDMKIAAIQLKNSPTILCTGFDITERKKADVIIRESEKKYRELFDNNPHPMWVYDMDSFSFLNVNDAAIEKYGFSRDEFLRMSIKDIRPEEDIERLTKNVSQVIEGMNNAGIWRHRKKDGSLIYVEIDSHTIMYEGKRAEMVLATDITERRRSEEALRESEERFRTLTETAATIIIIYQGEYIQYVNHATELLLGYTKEELLSMKYWEIIHPDQQEMARERGTARGRGENVPNEIEIKILTKTGDVRWINYTVAMIELSGKPAVLGTAFDITERKKAETDLAENKNYLQKIIENEPECVKVINTEGELLEMNAAGLSMLEAESIDDIRRLPMNNIINPKYHLQYKELLRRTLNGERGMLEFEITGLKGTHRWLETHAAPISDNQGSVIKVVEVTRDITERKKAEIQLRQNEERYRSIVENVREAYYEANARSLFTYCNPGSVLMSGYNQEELKEMSCFRLVAEEHRMKIRNRYLQWVKEQRAVMISEFILQKKTGEKLWVEQTTYFEYGKGGNVLNTTNFIKNIEERKKSDRQIEMLAHALRSINDCVTITDLNDTFIFVNEAFSALYGYKPHEVIGKNVSILLSPKSDSKILPEILRETRINGWHGEVLNRKKNGKEVIVALSTSVIRDDDGTIIALIGVAQDITERKKTEDKLRTHFRAIEQSGSTIIITDADGNIEYVNPALTMKTGYTYEEVIGKNPRIFQSGQTLKKEYQQLWRTILAGTEWHAELLNKKKNGELYWEEKSISPIIDDHGAISHFLGIGDDITEKKRLNEHLMQSQKAESIGTLASGIAHDFNNVLGIILAYTSFMDMAQSDKKVTSESLQAITKAVHRGANLVKQILTFAKKTDTTINPMNVKELIDEISSMLQQTFPKIVEITTEVDKDLPLFNADRIKIYQALMNLCVNARDAMPNGGTVTIRATTMSRQQLPQKYAGDGNDHFVALSVSDSGTGMSAETVQRIFDPFFTTKEFGKGTGIGLSVVYGIVQLHKGYIDVESELGKGTTFTLFLPITDQKIMPNESEMVPQLAVQGGTETILIVEDEELLLTMIKTILESNGYTVVVARNGEEAVDIYKLKKDSIHLVLTDMGLPKLTGYEEFKKMKEINPEVKVIFASGYFESNQKSELYKHGAMAFVQKPYAGNEILKVIREALG